MYKNYSKLVGIFSSGKSGSTLAIRLLDKYTNCFVYPEEISFLSVFADNLVNIRTISNKVWWISSILLLLTQMVDVQYYDIRISISLWILITGLKCIIKESDILLKSKN